MKEQLLSIIKEAGEIFKDGYFKTKDITFKGKKDLVTQYDVAVEQFLIKEFHENFREFNIIAEESDNDDVPFHNSIIIDPIDGTTNFVNKIPHCAISVGVYKEKKPYMGVVYNPILDELFFAQIGKGAYLNDTPLKVSEDENLITALIATGFPYSAGTNPDDLNMVVNIIRNMLPNSQDVRRLGSASLDLCYVAQGKFGGYYEINLKPWDVSAGIIIVQEAGGIITNQNGEPFDMFKDKMMVASNKIIHQEFLTQINS